MWPSKHLPSLSLGSFSLTFSVRGGIRLPSSMVPLPCPLVQSLFTRRITEASGHTPGLVLGGSQSEAVWTNASEKLPLPRKQYQPLRSKEHAKWLVVELELTSANEKFKPPNEHRAPSLTRPLRPGCSLDGGPPTPSPRGSCLHAGRAARPRPRHPDAQPLEPRGPRRPFLGYFLSRHQIRHSI